MAGLAAMGAGIGLMTLRPHSTRFDGIAAVLMVAGALWLIKSGVWL